MKEYEWEAANRVSQRLAHSSTPRHAGELNFRVRDGYGCNPRRCGRLNADQRIRTVAYANLASVVYTRVYAQSSSRLDHPEYSTVVPVCGMTNGMIC